MMSQMMSNKEKKEYLLGYQRIHQRINQLLLEQQQLRELTTRASPNISGMPRGGGGGPQGAIARIVDLEAEINTEVDRLVDRRREIEGAIATVGDEVLREILEYRYINGKKWEEIALILGYHYRYVLKMHGRALTLLPDCQRGHQKALEDTLTV